MKLLPLPTALENPVGMLGVPIVAWYEEVTCNMLFAVAVDVAAHQYQPRAPPETAPAGR